MSELDPDPRRDFANLILDFSRGGSSLRAFHAES